MSLYGWIKAIFAKNTLQIDDPVFGPLHAKWVEYRHERYVCWDTERAFPELGEGVLVSIFTSDASGPTDWQHDLFSELRRRFTSLRKTIESPLASEYEAIRCHWKLDSPRLITPDEIWNVATLIRIEINQQHGRNSDLVLDHQINWEAEDHDLNVSITNWQVDQVGLEG